MVEIIKSDVLVIGSGGAGLRAAIELYDNKINVIVVGKSQKRDGHTIMATGGINAALGNMDSEDSWQLHAADTIKDGMNINDTSAVLTLCKNAPIAIKELSNWGVKFDKDNKGKILQRFFGAATFRRACFIGDHTGKEILNTLVDQVNKRKIRFKSKIYIFSLLKNKGVINGALGLDIKSGKFIVFNSKIVIISAGGHSRIFKRSSSRFWENNGDGAALAYAVGSEFMDMEMFQFHPTGMVYPSKAEGILVTEAVRGEGGRLFNSKGERFMEKYDSKRMELSARSIVAKAIYDEVKAGRGTKNGGVWLDISHKSKKYILKRLPKMYKQFMNYGIDISKKKMEVSPTAHYSMGGIKIDHETGKTRIKNLFAIGEVTSGIHGANRLGGNSLAEIIVFGRLTAKSVIKYLKRKSFVTISRIQVMDAIKEVVNLDNSKGKNPITVKMDLQKMMWKNAGVVRNEKGLKKGLRELEMFRKIKLKIGKNIKMNEKLIASLDIRNMIPVCEMILKSALFRKDSRGAHYRSDYPETLKKWKKNVVCKPIKNRIKISSSIVEKVPAHVEKYMKESVKYHLLE